MCRSTTGLISCSISCPGRSGGLKASLSLKWMYSLMFPKLFIGITSDIFENRWSSLPKDRVFGIFTKDVYVIIPIFCCFISISLKTVGLHGFFWTENKFVSWTVLSKKIRWKNLMMILSYKYQYQILYPHGIVTGSRLASCIEFSFILLGYFFLFGIVLKKIKPLVQLSCLLGMQTNWLHL